VQTTDPNEQRGRLDLLHGAEKARRDLKGTFTPELRKLATSPLEIIFLSDAVEPEQRAQAKSLIKQAIDSALVQAIPASDTKTFSFGVLSSIDVDVIEWAENDLAMIRQLVSTVEASAVLTWYLPQLLSYVQILVLRGPRSFADTCCLTSRHGLNTLQLDRNQ
jgi:hypothetical protein